MRASLKPSIKWADRATAFLFLLLLGFLFAKLDHPGYFSGDFGVVWIQAESLASRSFSSLAIRHPGEEFLNGAYQDDDGFLIRQGRFLKAVFPPAFAAAAAVLEKLLGARGLFVLPLLGLAGLVFVARSFFRESSTPYALAIAAIASTPAVFYGFTLSAHAPAAFLALGACLAALGPGEVASSRRSRLVLAGVLVGMAVWFRTDAFCMIPALAIGIIHGGHKAGGVLASLARYSGGVMASIGPLLIFNYIAYSNPLGLHYANNMAVPANWLAGREYIAPLLLAGGKNTLLIAATVSCLILILLAGPRVSGKKTRAALLPATIILIFFGLQFHPSKNFLDSGLFWTMPALALTPLALWPRKHNLDLAADHGPSLFLTGVVYILLVLLITPTDGGIQWGPRLFLPGLPPMSVAILLGLRRWPRGRTAWIGAALVAGVLFAGAAVGYQGLKKMRERETALGTLRDMAAKTIPDNAAVISDLWWAEQVMPETFFRCLMFYVATPASAERLLNALGNKGVSDFWLILAPEKKGGVIEQALFRMKMENDIQVVAKYQHPYHNLIVLHVETDRTEKTP